MPLDHIGHLMSEASSAGLMLVCSIAAVVAFLFVRARAAHWGRRAREGEEALAGAGTLREGGSVVVGAVQTDGESPVTVSIHEEGREWHDKGGMRHSWRETHREASSRAFVIVTGKNERVRVEPSADVVLVDHLKVASRLSRTERIRKAELVAGERVTVTGRLRRPRAGASTTAYRTAEVQDEVAWILDPPPTAQMVVSTEPLTQPDRGWETYHRRLAWVPLVYLLVVNAIAYRTFYDFSLHGRSVVGHVAQRERTSSSGPHGLEWHRRVYVDLGGEGVWVPLDGATYEAALEGAPMPVVVTPSGRVSYGAEAGLNVWLGLVFVVAGGVLALCALVITENRKQWWERRPFVTSGMGALPEWKEK